MQEKLIIRGAREHNLKDISLDLPRDSMIVFTGLSGSGKSSLAFDTIFAEGQRRYVESLSAYARQFLGQMDKPDVDFIEGLSPAISIDQKSASRNPRSTVGTITEVYDYLRLLYARIGVPHCPNDGTVITRQTPHDRCQHLEAGALGELEHPVDDLLRGLALDRRPAHGAVRTPGAGVEEAEVVVDLGDGADRRARVLGRGLLVDAHRGRQALDEVDVRLVHLAEELAGVRRQRLDVAPLALGEDRVEGEARLARARETREDDEGVAGQVERDVLEVVLPGTPNHQLIRHVPNSVTGHRQS